MNSPLHALLRLGPVLALLTLAQPAAAQTPAAAAPVEQKPFKLGVVTFLSGAAAGPFGVDTMTARAGGEELDIALLGYELVEGRLDADKIVETHLANHLQSGKT